MRANFFWKKTVILVTALAALTACAKANSTSDQVADGVQKFAGCSNYGEKIRSVLAQSLIDGEDLPSTDQIEASLRRQFPDGGDQNRLVEEVMAAYKLLSAETAGRLHIKTRKALLTAMMEIEMGDRTTPEKAQLGDELNAQFAKINDRALAAGATCQDTAPTPTPAPDGGGGATPISDNTPSSSPTPTPVPGQKAKVISGAMRVMATAYQDCQAVRLPAMTGSTASVSGITITGHFPGGGEGLTREITALNSLIKSHYYLKQGILSGSGCYNVAQSPPIYDFGGKPYASSADDSALDFFRNAGEGTKVLGTDCSGFVFSSLAVQGMRLIPNKKLKALQVEGVNAAMMMNPQSNGLTCLAATTMAAQNPLQSGDILASSGHVVMIDVTSGDPFGLSRAKSVSDCTTAKLGSSGFNFEILQSSPIKGGIGLDRIRAADYLTGGSSMQVAMESYAVSACKVRFGRAADAIPSTAHLVRHKGTTECMDKPVQLAGEACVKSCYAGTGVATP